MDGLVYVPEPYKKEVFADHHETLVAGHQGIEKTIARITRNYYWPHLYDYVQTAIRKCDTCLRNKASRHKKHGLLRPLQAPDSAWSSVAMDFITKLPKSQDPTTGVWYDSILVVTDRLTKFGYFIPFQEETDSEKLSQIFNRWIVATHGPPREIISDRDVRFTSNF